MFRHIANVHIQRTGGNPGIAWYAVPTEDAPLMREGEKLYIFDISELVSALRDLTPQMPPKDAPCHNGIVPQERCAYCQRVARARKVLIHYDSI